MIEEFKKFIMRGNVLDMAVGIIIGAAFGKIVTSFVNDLLMPPLGLVLGHVDFPICSSTFPPRRLRPWLRRRRKDFLSLPMVRS